MKAKIDARQKVEDLNPDERDCIIKTLENKSHFSEEHRDWIYKFFESGWLPSYENQRDIASSY